MVDEEMYNKIANKLANITDKFLEIEPVTRTITLWAKENNYELIPLIKILNAKMKDISDIMAN